jgi:hypothetical protein
VVHGVVQREQRGLVAAVSIDGAGEPGDRLVRQLSRRPQRRGRVQELLELRTDVAVPGRRAERVRIAPAQVVQLRLGNVLGGFGVRPPRRVGVDRLASTASRSTDSTSRPLAVSSAPVGSSANSTAGRASSARAMATRCCCPPDSSGGSRVARSASPSRARIAPAARRSAFWPANFNGSVTFCVTVRYGIRLYCWNTKPIRSRRNSVISASPPRGTSAPSTNTCPDVGSSRPAAHCSSVLFPEPDGPITEVKLPAASANDTPRSAATGLVSPYTFVTDTSRSASPSRRRGRTVAGGASSADLAVMTCSSRHVQPACRAAQHQR